MDGILNFCSRGLVHPFSPSPSSMSRCHFGCDNVDFFSTPGSFSPRWAGEYIFFSRDFTKSIQVKLASKSYF